MSFSHIRPFIWAVKFDPYLPSFYNLRLVKMLAKISRRVSTRDMAAVLSDRVKNPDVQKNVWVEFVGLAMEHKALNVGQGKLHSLLIIRDMQIGNFNWEIK